MHQFIKRLAFSLGPLLCEPVEAQEPILVAPEPERAHAVDVIPQGRTDAAAVAWQWLQARQCAYGILAQQGGHDRRVPVAGRLAKLGKRVVEPKCRPPPPSRSCRRSVLPE